MFGFYANPNFNDRWAPILSAYKESMTVLEMVQCLKRMADELHCNEVELNEKMNRLIEWIEKDGMEQYVIEEIRRMYKSGELATIINEEIFGALNAKIDKQYTELFAKVDKVKATLERMQLVVTDYGVKGDGLTNDTKAIQDLLNLAGPGKQLDLFFPAGTYNLYDMLRLKRNTTIKASPNAVFKRKGDYGSMIINGQPGENYYAYEGNGNIRIEGGIWDGNIQEVPTAFNHMTFGHAENIHIVDVTLKDNYNNHHLEFNAIKDGKVLNCRFIGHVTSRVYVEAIQIDLMRSSEQFPSFGYYDNTTCIDIVVDGCLFQNVHQAIGSHSLSTNIYHHNINFVNNTCRNLTGVAVLAINWKNTRIINNHFENCGGGVQMDGTVSSNIDGFVISGNTFRKMVKTTFGKGRAIDCSGLNIGGGVIRNGSISNNVIEETYDQGIRLNATRRTSVVGNTIQFAGGEGIGLYTRCEHIVISGNTINQGKYNGIMLYGSSSQCNISGNEVFWNDANGITIQDGSYDNLVNGNTVHANNLSGIGASNISVVSNASYNAVTNNMLRQGTESNKPAYGITITATALSTYVNGNDLFGGTLNNASGTTIVGTNRT